MWSQLSFVSLCLCLIIVESASTQALTYGQYCSRLDKKNKTEICEPNQVCHRNRCKCAFGFGYEQRKQKCVKFDDYECSDDSDCNAVDRNRVCDRETNKCECNHSDGFFAVRDTDNRLCMRKHHFLNHSCVEDHDCPLEYSHCKNHVCRCWPEFKPKFERVNLGPGIDILGQSCQRRICSTNLDCQTQDNPNLVCNNTICECEFGYALDAHRTCVKQIRRQNCNITCQIIGGLFASIFMLSLIYWCFYCCYSIVKNYRMHSRSRESVHSSHATDESPQSQRFIRTQSQSSRVHPNSDHNFSINADQRFYYFDGQTPPTYSQLSDEPPDYETVVHMKTNP